MGSGFLSRHPVFSALADESTARYRDGRPLSPIDGMPGGTKDIVATVDMSAELNGAVYKEGCQPSADAGLAQRVPECTPSQNRPRLSGPLQRVRAYGLPMPLSVQVPKYMA